MEKRYRALRIIGTVYKILGTLAGLITILIITSIWISGISGGLWTEMFSSRMHGILTSGAARGFFGAIALTLGVLIYGGGASVTFFALGEGIYLLLALEENTRATAALINRRTAK